MWTRVPSPGDQPGGVTGSLGDPPRPGARDNSGTAPCTRPPSSRPGHEHTLQRVGSKVQLPLITQFKKAAG